MAAKARDNWKQTGFTNMAGQQSPDFRQPLNTPAPYDAYTRHSPSGLPLDFKIA